MLLTLTGTTHDDTSKYHIVSVKINTTFRGKRLSPIRWLKSAPFFTVYRVTNIYTVRSSLYLWLSIICSCFGRRWENFFNGYPWYSNNQCRILV